MPKYVINPTPNPPNLTNEPPKGCSFTGITYIPEDIKSVFGLDTVCPEAVHSNGKSHLTMHNSYPGHQGPN